jgi:hypothetical protein
VLPFLVGTGAHPSDIGRVGRKFPWYLRLGTYARRGLNEVRRYRHYAIKDPVWLNSLRYRLARRTEPRQEISAPAYGP